MVTITPIDGANKRRRGGSMSYRRSGRDILIDAGLRAFQGKGPRLVTLAAKKLAQMAVKSAKADPVTKYRKSGRSRKSDDRPYVSGGKFSRSKKTNPFKEYTKKGMVTTMETGTVLNGTTGQPSLPVYCGHSTHGNVYLIQRTFWRAVVRDIFRQAGIVVIDIETDSPGSYTLNYEYSYNLNNASTVVPINCAGKSYNQIASDLYNAWTVLYSNLSGQSFIYLTEIAITDGSRVLAKRDYQDASISVLVKSDFKIQNRTLASGTDQNNSENIANQPLYGKSYSGKGNGLVCKIDSSPANSGKSLLTGEQTGMLAYSLSGLTTQFWLNEPPLPTLLIPKPKYHKASIEPGTVKTSSLQAKMSCHLLDFWKMLQVVPQVNVVKGAAAQSRYGQYHIFAFEKMITATAADTLPSLGLETNQRCGVYITFKRVKDSAEVIEGQTFI